MAKCQIEPLWETYTRTSVEWHARPGRSQGAFSRFSRLFFFLELPRRFPRRSINYFPPLQVGSAGAAAGAASGRAGTRRRRRK